MRNRRPGFALLPFGWSAWLVTSPDSVANERVVIVAGTSWRASHRPGIRIAARDLLRGRGDEQSQGGASARSDPLDPATGDGAT
jgi:hypothetical protein